MTPPARLRSPARRPAGHRTCLRVMPLEDRSVPSAVHGVVFDDANDNGVRDAGEAGLAGWAVYLDVNRNGVADAGELAAVTDAAGGYAFDTTDQPPAQVGSSGSLADYLALDLQAGTGGRWVNTTATFARVIRNLEPDAVRDFGVRFQPSVGATPVGAESRVNAATADPQLATAADTVGVSVSADAAGNYVVAWRTALADGTDAVYARVFNADGTPRTGDIQVASGTGSYPRVAMAGTGGFMVAWSSQGAGGNPSVYARAYAADGTPAGPQVTVLAATTKVGGGMRAVAADGTGRFAVLYASYPATGSQPTFKLQRYTATGSASGGATTVATPTLVNGEASLALDAAGNAVVVWDDASGGVSSVYAQRYTSAGRSVGGRITVASGSGVVWKSSVAMNASGRFAVAWNDRASGEKRARVYDANGTPLGAVAAFGVRSDFESVAGVAVDSAGNVTLTWTDRRQPGDGTTTYSYSGVGEVRLRRLTAGGVLEPETVVNTTTQGRQELPGVAATGDGSFVVVWQGYGPGDDAGIFAQRFAPPSSAPTVALAATTPASAGVEVYLAPEPVFGWAWIDVDAPPPGRPRPTRI